MAQILLTVDLGYGDSGKGTMVDAFARNTPTALVVRYSGGAQASHNVIAPDGTYHRFAQFGSATLIPGVRTYLGPQMLVHPAKLLLENDYLKRIGIQDALQRLTIDRKSPLISEFNVVINQTRELVRGEQKHGSCGMGIYETRLDTQKYGDSMLLAEDIQNIPRAKEKLLFFREEKKKVLFQDFPKLFGQTIHPSAKAAYTIFTDDQYITETLEMYKYISDKINIGDASIISSAIETGKQIIFEPSQGVLLDETHGFLPYVTGSDVTLKPAYELLESIGSTHDVLKIGILRSYMCRHGAGPLITEDTELKTHMSELHNSSSHPWQGIFRFGWFDPIAISYAIQATGGIDGLAVTCLDQAEAFPEYKYAEKYKTFQGNLITEIPSQLTYSEAEKIEFTQTLLQSKPLYKSHRASRDEILKTISSTCNSKIFATSFGPSALDKAMSIDF